MAAVEFRPGNRRVVHHALFFLDALGQARKRDGEDGKPGYSTFGGIGVLPTGSLGGWAPGTMPRRLPEGTGMYLAQGKRSCAPTALSSLTARTKPISRRWESTSRPKLAKTIVGGVAVRSRSIDIPPGESHYEVHAQSQPLPAEVKVLGIFPHMHYLGREMKVAAVKPDGVTVPMIWIRDWDFNWQGAYVYEPPLALPKGTVINVDAVYDNSSDNPKNPSNPPKRVHWGEQTTDEMCLCATTVVTKTPADLVKIRAMNFGQLGAILGGGAWPIGTGERAGAKGTTADTGKEARAKVLRRLPANGFAIPEAFRETLAPFDTDHDGRLSPAEIEAMPEPARSRVIIALQKRFEGS